MWKGKVAMKLRWIDSNGVSERDLADLADLRKHTDGFLWLDIPEWSDKAILRGSSGTLKHLHLR